MLIEFRVANHRSLRDEQVLTMEAGRVGDEADLRPRRVPGHSEPLLTVAGLYGANASGKSNVLAALAFMCEAVVASHRFWASDEELPRDPFAWGPKKTEPSLFEVAMLLNGVRYQYGFRASDERFLEEWLYAWPIGKKQVWFERDCDSYKFGENLRGENKLIQEVTRPNALFLSAAAQHNHPQLQPIFASFRSIRPINLSIGSRRPYFDPLPTEERARPGRLDALLPRLMTLLTNADIGIVGLRAERNKSEDEPKHARSPMTYSLKHQSESGDAWLPLKEESQGTRTLWSIGWPILEAIEDGDILLVDELERSLHPVLAQQIVRQFNDPTSNPRNAQLIFTTHDTNLLGTTVGEPVLRRDQVWLTEKDAEGGTVLYPLTDYKPRKAENLERGYLQGRYGAIPFLGEYLVAPQAK